MEGDDTHLFTGCPLWICDEWGRGGGGRPHQRACCGGGAACADVIDPPNKPTGQASCKTSTCHWPVASISAVAASVATMFTSPTSAVPTSGLSITPTKKLVE